MNISKVKQNFLIVEKIEMHSDNSKIYAYLAHWKGKLVPWETKMISFDLNSNLHGVCAFELPEDKLNTTGRHDFLNWSLTYFSGYFNHGRLQGLVLMKTLKGSTVYAMFKDGELHGPAYAAGSIPIYDYEVGTHQGYTLNFKSKSLAGKKYIGILES